MGLAVYLDAYLFTNFTLIPSHDIPPQILAAAPLVLLILGELERGQTFDDPNRLNANLNNLFNQPDDIFFVVVVVGVFDHLALIVPRYLMLVNNPMQRGTVSDFVLIRLWGNARERQEIVISDLRFVSGECHLLDLPI